MIVQEYYATRLDEVRLFRTYSDQNKYIRQIETGIIYDSAIDPEFELDLRHYEETDTPIEEIEEE